MISDDEMALRAAETAIKTYIEHFKGSYYYNFCQPGEQVMSFPVALKIIQKKIESEGKNDKGKAV